MSRPLTLVIAIMVAACLRAAPLPFPKPASPPIAPGVCYSLHWCGPEARYVTVFHPGGDYECFAAGEPEARFAGIWRVEGGTLIVDEHGVDASGGGWLWTWHPKAGATLGGRRADIRLAPLRPACRCGKECPNGGCCASCGCAGPKRERGGDRP